MQHTIDKDQPTTVKITVPDDTWDILKDVSVTTQNDWGVLITSTATNTHLTVNGTVEVATLDEAAINSTADGVNITVGADGSLLGEKGLNFFGTHAKLANYGSIAGTQFGIFTQGVDSQLTNNGSIASSTGHAVEIQNDLSQLANYGTVKGDVGVHIMETVTSQQNGVYNFGLIAGAHGAIVSDDTGTGYDYVDNKGIIKGDVSLGAADDTFKNIGGLLKGDLLGGSGTDTFTLTSGKVVGAVHGGDDGDIFYLGPHSVKGIMAGDAGNDIYHIDHADAQIVEEANQGTADTIMAQSDYTLAKNVHIEFLYADLSGITVTGNNLDNGLIGSFGGEHLSGGGGHDPLDGRGGPDLLSGGAGSDSFIFYTGDGVDHISDFQAAGSAHDEIHLSPDYGIETFNELKPHLSQQGDNVVINLGHGDKIVLDHLALADLSANDFVYNVV